MPKVHYVKRARKPNPVAEIGQPYYWWKFRYGGKHFSRTKPRASQLTQSPYLSAVHGMREQVEGWRPDDWSELKDFMEDLCEQISCLRDETQDSLDNMPDSLHDSPSGELLQERIEALESAESTIQCIDGPDGEDDWGDFVEGARSEIIDAICEAVI